MKTLSEYVKEAEDKKVAIGHFNISNIEGFWAVVKAAKNLSLPVIIGVSEGERDFVGIRQAAALVKSYREETGQPVFLNADHTYTFDRVKEAVDAGFDSVIYDGAEKSFEDNIKETKKCRDYIDASGRNVILEGELGYIGKSSKILDDIPDGAAQGDDNLTKAEDARRFVEETGVNLLAPAVGNIHGMLKGGKDPALNVKRVREIKEASGVPLVLHGGSGNSKDDFKEAIKEGVAIVHINTEIRVAYKNALKLFLQDNPDEVAPYKIMKSSVVAMQKVIEDKLKLFNNL